MSEQTTTDPSQETSEATPEAPEQASATPDTSASAEPSTAQTPASTEPTAQTPESSTAGAVAAGATPGTNASTNSTSADINNLAGQQNGSPDAAIADATSGRALSAKSSSHKSGSGKKEASATPSASDKTSPSAPVSGKSTHRRKRTKLGELDLSTAKIGFLGAGKMAESTVNGLIHYAKVSPGRIHVAAPTSKGLERFKTLGCRVTKRNYDIFGRYDCDIIFLCFHGYVIKHCYKLGGARPHPLTTNYIPHQRHPIYILSLVSGVSLSQIKACLLNPESNNRYTLEIHRIMMNTAVGHGLGICAIDCEPDSKKLSAPIRSLLSSIAQLENVPASQMDAACAIGGSGLAFSYYFINALADGAFKMGLSRQQAIRFASKTAQCAAQTMVESGKHPAELRDNVSSPSGAAIYGIHVLEKNDVASGVTAAVEAAHKRANDLAHQEVS